MKLLNKESLLIINKKIFLISYFLFLISYFLFLISYFFLYNMGGYETFIISIAIFTSIGPIFAVTSSFFLLCFIINLFILKLNLLKDLFIFPLSLLIIIMLSFKFSSNLFDNPNLYISYIMYTSFLLNYIYLFYRKRYEYLTPVNYWNLELRNIRENFILKNTKKLLFDINKKIFLISYFLFLISYFLFLISYFLFLISYYTISKDTTIAIWIAIVIIPFFILMLLFFLLFFVINLFILKLNLLKDLCILPLTLLLFAFLSVKFPSDIFNNPNLFVFSSLYVGFLINISYLFYLRKYKYITPFRSWNLELAKLREKIPF